MRILGRKCLALLLSVTLLFSLVSVAAAAEPAAGGPPSSPFWDTYGTKYQSAVDALYAIKVVSGKSDTSFKPYDGVTRAQMAAFVVRALGKEDSAAGSASFPDVKPSYWAAQQIAAAADLGIVRGSDDGKFHPEEPVTYVQVVAMLLRAVGLEYQAGSYPTGYVVLANNLGLIKDTDWQLDGPASRGDVALMLYRTIFTVPGGYSGKTLSQSVFQHPGSVAIQPAVDVVTQGQNQLSAKVLDWVGKELALPVNWSIQSGNATVDATGKLNVTGDAAVTVLATANGAQATRTYNVVRSLSVRADKTAVSSGDHVQLTAVGIAASGREVPITPAWSVVSGSGTVSDTGVLTLNGSGSVTVRAAAGSLTADLTISVVGGISITPAQTVAGPNQDVQLTATVKDAAGNSTSAPVVWSVTGGGTIDQNGKLHTGTADSVVTATAGGFHATVTVSVIGRIEVSPATGSFRKGEAQQFAATVYTAGNQPLTVPVQWSVEPTTMGFMGADGRFFAANPGTGSVVATYGGLTTRVPVSVAGEATGLQLSATPTGLPANGTSTATITARLVDANGNTAAGADNIFFSISSGNLGKLDHSTAPVVNGYATATLTVGGAAGTYTIRAAVPGSNIPGASLTFVTTAPTPDHVALEIYPNPLAAQSNSQTTVTAKLVDATGAAIANRTGNVINVTLSQSNTGAGRLTSTFLQIGNGESSAKTFFTANDTPGVTVISGTATTFRVTSATITSQVVGAPYKLAIRPGIPDTRADGVQEMPVNVEVRDINGNIRTSDNNVIVSLSATNGTSTIQVPSQQTNWGVATFKLKTTTAGAYTLNAWSANTALQTDSTTASFTPGNPYKVSLKVEPYNEVAADLRTTVTLKAQILDNNNNLVPTATNQITFIRETASQNVLTLPSTMSVYAVNGVATIQLVTTAGVGTDYYHAEGLNLLTSNTSTVSTRITGVPTRAVVQSLTQATTTAGVPTTVQVWIMDSLGRLASGDSGRMVTLQAGNGATVSSPTPTVNGIATFTVSNTLVGGVQLTAVADGVTPDQAGRVLTVVAGSPDHVQLKASPEAISADGTSSTIISASLADKYGNAAGGGFPVTLSLSTNDFLTLSSLQLTTGGQITARSKSTTPGTTMITGTAGGYVVMPLTISTYHPGNPTRVVLDSLPTATAGNAYNNQVVVKARILDDSGNQLTSLNTGGDVTAMALEVSGSTGTNSTNVTIGNNTGLLAYGITPNGVTYGSATVQNGIAQFTVTNTKAETVTLTPIVYYRGQRLQGTPSTFTTTPGLPTRITASASTTTIPANSPTSITVTAAVTDMYGNPASTTPDTITFNMSTTVYIQAPSPNVIQTSNGSATVSLVSNTNSSGGTTVITATSSRLGLMGTVTITSDLFPDKPNVIARDTYGYDSIVTPDDPGARIIITAPVRNTDQQVIVYVNGVAVPLYTASDSNITTDTIVHGSNNLIGYIKRSDLGGSGQKEIRVMLQSSLGMSPLSDSVYLTCQ